MPDARIPTVTFGFLRNDRRVEQLAAEVVPQNRRFDARPLLRIRRRRMQTLGVSGKIYDSEKVSTNTTSALHEQQRSSFKETRDSGNMAERNSTPSYANHFVKSHFNPRSTKYSLNIFFFIKKIFF